MRDVSHYTKNHLWLRAVPCFKPLCLLHWAKIPLRLGQVDLHSRLLSIFFPSQAWPIPICGPAACNYAKSFTEVLVQLLLMQGVFWKCFTCFAYSLLLILSFFFFPLSSDIVIWAMTDYRLPFILNINNNNKLIFS